MLWPCKHESHFDPALYHSTCFAFPNAYLQVFSLIIFFDLIDILIDLVSKGSQLIAVYLNMMHQNDKIDKHY